MGRPFSREFRGRGGEDFLIQEHEREEKNEHEEKEVERIIDDYSEYLYRWHDSIKEKFDLVEKLMKELQPYFRTVPELDKYLVRANFYRFFEEVDYEEDGNMFRSVPKTLETFLEFYERFKISPGESFELSSTNFESPLTCPVEAIFIKKIEEAKKKYPESDKEDQRFNFIKEEIEKYTPMIDDGDLTRELLLDSDIVLNNDFALKLVNANFGWVVVRNLDMFSGLDKELAENLINNSSDYDTICRVIEQREIFSNFVLDRKIALNLVNSGKAYVVFCT